MKTLLAVLLFAASVLCATANEVHVIDMAKLEVTAKVAVERGPGGISYWEQK